jgi:hypothetical protein
MPPVESYGINQLLNTDYRNLQIYSSDSYIHNSQIDHAAESTHADTIDPRTHPQAPQTIQRYEGTTIEGGPRNTIRVGESLIDYTNSSSKIEFPSSKWKFSSTTTSRLLEIRNNLHQRYLQGDKWIKQPGSPHKFYYLMDFKDIQLAQNEKPIFNNFIQKLLQDHGSVAVVAIRTKNGKQYMTHPLKWGTSPAATAAAQIDVNSSITSASTVRAGSYQFSNQVSPVTPVFPPNIHGGEIAGNQLNEASTAGAVYMNEAPSDGQLYEM